MRTMIEKKQKESYFNIYKKKDPSCCAIKLIFHTLEFILQKKHTYIHQNCIYINTIICYKSLSSAALYIFHQAIVVMFIPIS